MFLCLSFHFILIIFSITTITFIFIITFFFIINLSTSSYITIIIIIIIFHVTLIRTYALYICKKQCIYSVLYFVVFLHSANNIIFVYYVDRSLGCHVLKLLLIVAVLLPHNFSDNYLEIW